MTDEAPLKPLTPNPPSAKKPHDEEAGDDVHAPLKAATSHGRRDSLTHMKTFANITITKPIMPMLKSLKEAPNFRHSSFFETSTVNKKHDEAGHKRLNQYILYDVIGQGAFGKVRKAYWPEREKYYAVKIINKKHVRRLSRSKRGPGGDGLETIRKEFAIWKQLVHPNIVKLKEVIDAPQSEKMYMVSELIEGGCVVDGETTCTPLEEEQAKRFFCQLIEGIDFLHFHKIIHRDVKPSNLLCGSDGVLKITDFGMSHVFEDENDDFRQTVGTGPFLAPEMLTGGKFKGRVSLSICTNPVDIWACGVTLYMFVYGHLPFQADSLPDLYDKIKSHPVAYPTDVNGRLVDADLIDLLKGILHRDPDTRLTTSGIRAHKWTQAMFTRVASVVTMEPISLTPESMISAISPIHLYERLHQKIKALVMANKLGQGMQKHERVSLPTLASPDKATDDHTPHVKAGVSSPQEVPSAPKPTASHSSQNPSPRSSFVKSGGGATPPEGSKHPVVVVLKDTIVLDNDDTTNQATASLSPAQSASKLAAATISSLVVSEPVG
ncbi:hypothetical protein AaE_006951 [Aphanomyces astaci]|uniref:Protein kinase domain-containing protein n=1 Tax=Aphanomyces astaci TaxID=112090 RepID=A0A6A5A3R7_APHAT|nr:hypothetical protein AaE_006951 [Aphanomyces astaci]